MSRAACRLPFSGTFSPWLWQGKDRLFFFFPCVAFLGLVFEIRSVRVVAGEAVANSWLVDGSLDLRRVLLGMAREAKLVRGSGGQLDAGDIFIHPHFVAAQAPSSYGRVDSLSFCLILVA